MSDRTPVTRQPSHAKSHRLPTKVRPSVDRTDANAMFRPIERQMLAPYRVELSQEYSPPAHAVA